MEQPETSAENIASSATGKRKGGSMRALIIAVILILLAGGAYFFFSSNSNLGGKGDAKIVATVNGVIITEKDVNDRIERNRATLVAQGTNIDDTTVRATVAEQVVAQLVNEALVLEDAKKKGITVTSDEIDTEFANIKARFENDEAFQTELTKNFFTEETLRENIERELLTQKYVQQISDNADVQVTEDEIVALYDQAKEQNNDIPPLEDVYAEAEAQIKNQKVAALVSEAVTKLRADADIVITQSADTNGEVAQ